MPQPLATLTAVKRPAVLGVKLRSSSVAPATDPWYLRERQTAIGMEAALGLTPRISSCRESHRHRGVCLKLLTKLAARLGLGQPCGIADLRRTSTCRQLLSGSLLDAHLTWCRHLLEAYDRLRQDRDDLALRCAEQTREAAKLEARIQQLDRQLTEARQQFERLQTAATAASITLRGRHESHELRVVQHGRPDTPTILPNAQDLELLIAQWEDCRNTSGTFQQEPQLMAQKPQLNASSPSHSSSSSMSGSGRGCNGAEGSSASSSSPLASVGTFNSAVSGRYHPPESNRRSRIPLPVWFKTPGAADTSDGEVRFSETPCQQGLQHLAKKPNRDRVSATSRRSRATDTDMRRLRHRRSRTYDKLAPELLDRWQQLLVPTVCEES